MATHDIGDTVRLWAAFFDEAGDQTAPGLVTLIVRSPDGTDTTVANEAAVEADLDIASAAVGTTLATETGVYKASVQVDQAGFWYYEWTGVGTVDEVQPGGWEVPRRRVGDPVVTP